MSGCSFPKFRLNSNLIFRRWLQTKNGKIKAEEAKLTVLEYEMVLRVFFVLEEKVGDKDDSCNQGVRDIPIGALCQIPQSDHVQQVE